MRNAGSERAPLAVTDEFMRAFDARDIEPGYVITRVDGRWGIQARPSSAP